MSSPYAPIQSRADRRKLVHRWKKHPKQVIASQLLQDNLHTLLYGGSRSGKTYVALRVMVLRALAVASRHLVLRLRFAHVKRAIARDTFPKLMRECFPDVPYHLDKGDWFVTLWPKSGGTSEIWFGGTDDPARMEHVLGTEYSTILFNEISTLKWDVIPTLWTRCAESSGLPLRMFYDCNPPFKRHWAYTMFFQAKDPKGVDLLTPKDIHDHESPLVPIRTASLLINPIDNPSLTDEYHAILRGLPQRAQDRYRHGIFLSDVEGALWTDDWIIQAQQLDRGELEEVIISLDPATTDTERSDEWGIVVLGVDEFGRAGVLKDLSKRMSVDQAAVVAVEAFKDYRANAVIVETNQGGDMCVSMVHNVDRNVPVIKVNAANGKKARALPVAQLYERDEVWHDERMPELEDQLTTWVPHETTKSPDRLDAVVTGLTHLILDRPGGTLDGTNFG